MLGCRLSQAEKPPYAESGHFFAWEIAILRPMLRWLLITLFLGILANQVQAQLRLQVLDSETKRPVPYAYIVLTASQRGIVTNEWGWAEFRGKSFPREQDSLLISALGYRTQSYAIQPWPIQVYLHTDPIDLPSVRITSKPADRYNLGLQCDKAADHIALSTPRGGDQLALQLEAPGPGYLRKVYLYQGKKSMPGREYRIRVYKADSTGTNPGSDVLREQVILATDGKKGWTEISLDSHFVFIPKGIFFVAIELFPIKALQTNIRDAQDQSPKTQAENFDLEAFELKEYPWLIGLCANTNDNRSWYRHFSGKWLLWPFLRDKKFRQLNLMIRVDLDVHQ